VIISNGVILSAEGEREADRRDPGETIAAVGPGLAAAAQVLLELTDATGRYMTPGGLDVPCKETSVSDA